MAEEKKEKQISIKDIGDSLLFGKHSVEQALLTIEEKSKRRGYFSSEDILNKIKNGDIKELRAISNYFFRTNGIYSRLCKYLAYLYKYDWYISPFIYDKRINQKKNKIMEEFWNISQYLENSYIANVCGKIALSTIINGCYYGYLVDDNRGLYIQDLPVEYCRTRFSKQGLPIVEFNMVYFDSNFFSVGQRYKVLKTFPPDFLKGYKLFKNKKLEKDPLTGEQSWYVLDTNFAIKITNGTDNDDAPIFINAIPSILDLMKAQEIEKKKMEKKLLNLIIQQIPLDKNGNPIIDLEEIADLHQIVSSMLKEVLGGKVLTTIADVKVEELNDRNGLADKDDLNKFERTMYNEFGVSRNLFNTESNLALEKSVLVDEAAIRNILQQFEMVFNRAINKKFNKNSKKYEFRFIFLNTTIYNYKELSKLYKEQSLLGYSKIYPQLALGHSQSELIQNLQFENEILDLSDLMIPSQMGSTMSGGNEKKNLPSSKLEEKKMGRPEKSDSEKSEKTIANRESL